jgi:hypothetical protein
MEDVLAGDSPEVAAVLDARLGFPKAASEA